MLSTIATAKPFFSPVLALIPLLLALLSSTSATDDAFSSDPDEISMLQTKLQTGRSLQQAFEGSQIGTDLAPSNVQQANSELDSSLELSVQNDVNTKADETKKMPKGKDDKKTNNGNGQRVGEAIKGIANNLVDNGCGNGCVTEIGTEIENVNGTVKDAVANVSDTIKEIANETVTALKDKFEEEGPARCLKDMTSFFVGDEFQCVLQNQCDYMVRVKCPSVTPGGYWDYAPKGCCQIPPPEFNVAPCQADCTVVKL